MTTERQKAANRANARRSTGPKTPKGKAAVRLNAIRHGLLARDEVKSYKKSVFSDAPLGIVIRDEASHSEATEALAEAESERDRDEVLLGCAFEADAKDGDAIAKLARYETRHERSLFRNLNELRQMQEKR